MSWGQPGLHIETLLQKEKEKEKEKKRGWGKKEGGGGEKNRGEGGREEGEEDQGQSKRYAVETGRSEVLPTLGQEEQIAQGTWVASGFPLRDPQGVS